MLTTSNIIKIGIKFPDNDYHLTIQAFLRCMADRGLESYSRFHPLTKTKIAELFNKSAPGLYWLVQNQLNFDANLFTPPNISHLKIMEDQVFLNQEVDDYLTAHEHWDNGEFHTLVTKPIILIGAS